MPSKTIRPPARTVGGQRTNASDTGADDDFNPKPEEDFGRPPPPFDAEPEFDTTDEWKPRPKTQDPAVLAAGIMLERAMTGSGASREELGRPGTVSLVSTPTADWAEPACEAWTALVSGPEDTMRAERPSGFGRSRKTMSFVGDKEPSKYDRDREAKAVEDAM